MAALVTINGTRYVTGLRWRTLTDRQEIRLLATEENTSRGVILYAPDGDIVGVGLADQFTRDMKKTPSAAALLAHSESGNVSVVEKIDDGSYWYCAVKDHKVVGGDVVVRTREEIQEQFNNDLSFGGEGLVLAGSGMQELCGLPPKVASVTDLFDAKHVAKACIRVVTGGAISPVTAAAAITIVATIGWAVFFGEDDDEALRAQQQQVAASLFQSGLSDAMGGYLPSHLMQHCLDTSGNAPASVYGWRLRRVECSGSGAVLAWENQGGTDETLRKALGGEAVTLLLDGSGAEVRRGIPAPAPAPRLAPDLPAFTPLSERLVRYLYDARAVGLLFAVGVPSLVSVPGAELSGKSFRRAPWTLSGGVAGLSADYVQPLDTSTAVATRLSVAADGDSITWSMEGHYVVQ